MLRPKVEAPNYDVMFEACRGDIRKHLGRLEDKLPTQGVAVDLGTGEGPGVVELSKKGLGVVGVDIDFSGVNIPQVEKRARVVGLTPTRLEISDQIVQPTQKKPVLVKGDARELKMPSNSADLITSFYVGGPSGVHETPWQGVFQKGAEILKPGGSFLITTEQAQNVPTIKKLLAKAGIKVVKQGVNLGTMDKHLILGKKP